MWNGSSMNTPFQKAHNQTTTFKITKARFYTESKHPNIS